MVKKDDARSIPTSATSGFVTNVSMVEPPIPTTVEILVKQRAEKIIQSSALDREIQKLDEDISFLQRHPEGDRILIRIAARLAAVLKDVHTGA